VIDKESFREQCKKYRSSLSVEQYRLKSQRILGRFQSHFESELANVNTIHSYIPIEENREVDTLPIIKHWLEKGQKLAVPKTDFDTLKMEHILLTELDQLSEQQMGILEPVRGDKCSPADFDLIIVPMVGADEKRNRIGYGKGFYDRFLAEINGLKAGLCYENCVSGEPITTNPHDVKMDVIITEYRVIG